MQIARVIAAVGEGEPVQLSSSRPSLAREAHDGEGAQMRDAETCSSPRDILINQDGVRCIGVSRTLTRWRRVEMQECR